MFVKEHIKTHTLQVLLQTSINVHEENVYFDCACAGVGVVQSWVTKAGKEWLVNANGGNDMRKYY